jgi:hypothetical protein
MAEKIKMAARHFNLNRLKFWIWKNQFIKKLLQKDFVFFPRFKMGEQFKMVPSTTVLYFWVLHSQFLTIINQLTYFELANLSSLDPCCIIQYEVKIQHGDRKFTVTIYCCHNSSPSQFTAYNSLRKTKIPLDEFLILLDNC